MQIWQISWILESQKTVMQFCQAWLKAIEKAYRCNRWWSTFSIKATHFLTFYFQKFFILERQRQLIQLFRKQSMVCWRNFHTVKYLHFSLVQHSPKLFARHSFQINKAFVWYIKNVVALGCIRCFMMLWAIESNFKLCSR